MRLPSATSTPRPSRQLWCVPRELKAARGQAHFLKKLLQAPAGTFLYSKRNALAEEHGRSVNSGGAVKGGLAAARSFCSSAGQEASVPTNTLVTGSRAAPLSATSQQLGQSVTFKDAKSTVSAKRQTEVPQPCTGELCKQQKQAFAPGWQPCTSRGGLEQGSKRRDLSGKEQWGSREVWPWRGTAKQGRVPPCMREPSQWTHPASSSSAPPAGTHGAHTLPQREQGSLHPNPQVLW